MPRTSQQLREDALAIFHAGLSAVASDHLVQQALRREGHHLILEDESIDLDQVGKIIVIGGGKAGAGMAAGLEAVLGPQVMQAKQLQGWLNVPADCVRELQRIHLHAARAAGSNEPTEEGVAGVHEMLKLADSLNPNDLAICLLSGGASALLPGPVPQITLADKQQVTRHLSGAGANIAQLNTVRKQLSRIKGGGLARACQQGRLLTLIISDVLGDPLDVIGSGPTVADTSTPKQALDILQQFQARQAGIAPAIFDYLESKSADAAPFTCQVQNLVIGNNATAVDAAGLEAERRGYAHAMDAAKDLEGPAEGIGRHLAQMALRMRDQPGPDCLITGGEPTVHLAPPEIRGKGGRNQQLALAALQELTNRDQAPAPGQGIALLSGGTDGEDGPTDAAGAIIDADLIAAAQSKNLDPADYLRRSDAYHFFQPLHALIQTGPTHTNVCDLRVVVVDRIETKGRTTP